MNKIEKALVKLFHALGEEKGAMTTKAENLDSIEKYLAFREMQSFPGNLACRYFRMGAAAALRQQLKPPGGKKKRSPGCAAAKPHGGQKNVSKRITTKRGLPKSTNWSKEDFEDDDFGDDYG